MKRNPALKSKGPLLVETLKKLVCLGVDLGAREYWEYKIQRDTKKIIDTMGFLEKVPLRPKEMVEKSRALHEAATSFMQTMPNFIYRQDLSESKRMPQVTSRFLYVAFYVSGKYELGYEWIRLFIAGELKQYVDQRRIGAYVKLPTVPLTPGDHQVEMRRKKADIKRNALADIHSKIQKGEPDPFQLEKLENVILPATDRFFDEALNGGKLWPIQDTYFMVLVS